MFKTILVPTDGTALSNRAVTAAIEFSRLHDSKIIALSVATPRLFYSTEHHAASDGAATDAENRKLAEQYVDDIAETANALNIPCETVISQSYAPCDEIISVAKRFQCDAIFMATRGRMGVLDTVFNESQTQNVLRNVSIPVLVFPQPDGQ